MKIIAVIPARGGSKRLPGKNTKLLGGKPLINWSIDIALASQCFEAIIVSTDDIDIAKVAEQAGASVPFLRPESLATDTAGSVEVVLHALEHYESTHGSVDGVLLLQPTSPFRKIESICKALELFAGAGGQRSVISVSPALSNPAWCFYCDDNKMQSVMGWELIGKRSQELRQSWELNGSIYLTSPKLLKSENSFITQNSIPLFQSDRSEAIDIDDGDDWLKAEAHLS
jgi:CMP-N,N'-diacetyllegionaminic acid synthase